MPAHYYQTVEMQQAADISDLVKENGTAVVINAATPPTVVQLWTMENNQQMEYQAVTALTDMAKAMEDIYANADKMHNFHLQTDVQAAIRAYYEYSQKQTTIVNSYYNLMASLGPSRVIPYDAEALPVFFIQFKDPSGIDRSVYVYVGSWLAAQYVTGYYGYLVGNLPIGTKITYGKMTYEI